MRHRPCCLVGAGCALVFLPLTDVRERSADWRYFIVWHLGEGARVPCGHAASRRSTVASSTPGPARRGPTGDFHSRDPGGFRRPSSGPYRPSFEGSPSFLGRPGTPGEPDLLAALHRGAGAPPSPPTTTPPSD